MHVVYSMTLPVRAQTCMPSLRKEMVMECRNGDKEIKKEKEEESGIDGERKTCKGEYI